MPPSFWLKPIFVIYIIRWLKPTAIGRVKILPSHSWDGTKNKGKALAKKNYVILSDRKESLRQTGERHANHKMFVFLSKTKRGFYLHIISPSPTLFPFSSPPFAASSPPAFLACSVCLSHAASTALWWPAFFYHQALPMVLFQQAMCAISF